MAWRRSFSRGGATVKKEDMTDTKEEIKKPITKVAIIGTATSSLNAANDLDDSWTIYSCNGAFHFLDRFDKHFELHGIPYLKNDVKPDPSYFTFLEDAAHRAVLNDKYEEYPLAEVYPLGEVTKFTGSNYFNNTIAYMIAYAMYANPGLTDLALIGVDMAGDTEYVHQRPCCEFYLGMAKAKGIEIHLPDVCPLLKASHLYGFEPLPHFMVSLRQKLKVLRVSQKQKDEDARVALTNQTYNKAMADLVEGILKNHQ